MTVALDHRSDDHARPAGDDEAESLAPTYSPSTPPPEASPPGRLAGGSASGSGGRSAQHTPPLHVGRVLAERWRVGHRIGMGGMASVHEGVDLRLERKVAIKILHPHVADSPDARMRLSREARAIAQLKHENVIEVYDYSIDDPGCTWLVTELVEGQTLRGFLESTGGPKGLMPELAAVVVAEVLRALKAAHEVGVVHRDVKPDNVLVGKDGRPKLSDFGIAQIIDEQKMTVTGNLVGSPSYMSPEQAEGRRTDHRTDLFSAGIMLYRLVTGALPFAGQNAIETLRKVAAVSYVDPVEVEPDCPGAMAAVIRRALAPRIEDRYQSADEMLADLAAITRDAGLAPAHDELPRFFADPAGATAEATGRVARAMLARGRALLQAGDEARALDYFTRARALGVSDEQSLDLVRVLSLRRDKSRARRTVWVASLAAVLVAIVGGGLFAQLSPAADRPPPSPEAPAPARAEAAPQEPPALEAAAPPAAIELASPAAARIGQPEEIAPPAPERSAEREAPKVERKDRRKKEERREVKAPPPPPSPPPVEEAPPKVEAPPAPPPRGELHIGASRWVDVYVDGVKLGRAPEQSRFRLPPGPHTLRAINPHCKPVEREIEIRAGETTKERIAVECP